MNLLCGAIAIVIMVIGGRVPIVKSTKICAYCNLNTPEICEEEKTEVACDSQEEGFGKLLNGTIFAKLPQSKLLDDYECFMVDLSLPSGDDVLRIMGCIPADIKACDLKLSNDVKTVKCKQCNDNGCNRNTKNPTALNIPNGINNNNNGRFGTQFWAGTSYMFFIAYKKFNTFTI